MGDPPPSLLQYTACGSNRLIFPHSQDMRVVTYEPSEQGIYTFLRKRVKNSIIKKKLFLQTCMLALSASIKLFELFLEKKFKV